MVLEGKEGCGRGEWGGCGRGEWGGCGRGKGKRGVWRGGGGVVLCCVLEGKEPETDSY